MGYAGGTSPSPTYRNIGDHAEAIQLDFDPTVITYEDLIDQFQKGNHPTRPPFSRQYMSAVFCHDAQQLAVAQHKTDALSQRLGRTIYTEIQQTTHFTLAEDYHQKYRLQRHQDLVAELIPRYEDLMDFLGSPTAMRLNAYAGGFVKKQIMAQELDQFDLTARGERLLKKMVKLPR